jgi:hypothetical protein
VFQFIEPEKEKNHQVIVQSSSPITQLYNYGFKIERYIEPTKVNVSKHSESHEPTLVWIKHENEQSTTKSIHKMQEVTTLCCKLGRSESLGCIGGNNGLTKSRKTLLGLCHMPFLVEAKQT